MKIAHPAFAGTLESSDLQVRIEPNNDGGIELVLDSTVEQQLVMRFVRSCCTPSMRCKYAMRWSPSKTKVRWIV